MVWSGVDSAELSDVFLKSLLRALKSAGSKALSGSGLEHEKERRQQVLKTAAQLLERALLDLEVGDRRPQGLASTRAPVCQGHLEDATRLMRSRGHPMAAPLGTLLRRLHWRPGEGKLATAAAAAQILVCDELHIGLHLQAPHSTQPLHARTEEEVIVPLSDTLWQLVAPSEFGGGRKSRVAATLQPRDASEVGSMVLHAAEELRGWATGSDPLLLVWIRYGKITDLTAAPKYPGMTSQRSNA
eukprot:TRINITY_DN9036_c0_g2_i1.p1 TRINITY_DN9036_c0_g2~~TRINITY_DN9036_c0_g2_i1.p1  ORF type:complete len:243 (-),score=48.81 TRINITY_DN9036_c0_g2_i1:107-835(-)